MENNEKYLKFDTELEAEAVQKGIHDLHMQLLPKSSADYKSKTTAYAIPYQPYNKKYWVIPAPESLEWKSDIKAALMSQTATINRVLSDASWEKEDDV